MNRRNDDNDAVIGLFSTVMDVTVAGNLLSRHINCFSVLNALYENVMDVTRLRLLSW
jgi:hypothetical protein